MQAGRFAACLLSVCLFVCLFCWRAGRQANGANAFRGTSTDTNSESCKHTNIVGALCSPISCVMVKHELSVNTRLQQRRLTSYSHKKQRCFCFTHAVQHSQNKSTVKHRLQRRRRTNEPIKQRLCDMAKNKVLKIHDVSGPARRMCG